MPSPFPGMNPYLEQDDVWQDFHESIIVAVREELVRQVVPLSHRGEHVERTARLTDRQRAAPPCLRGP